MKCSKILEQLEQFAPLTLACSWDNVGLLVGSRDKEVKKLYIALDATDEVIDNAILVGTDLLITHHPFIFSPLKKINCDDFISSRIVKLIRHDISYYALHTNFDVAAGGMADLAADRLKLVDTKPLEVTYSEENQVLGIGKIGNLEQAVTLRTIAETTKIQFGIEGTIVFGDLDKKISRVAVAPGSGKDEIEHALLHGADVLITGDIGHHHGIDAVARGMAIIDGGHYGLEHIFIDFIKKYLEQNLDDSIVALTAPISFPFHVL